MRLRTIFVPLLALYAIVLTVYLGFHTLVHPGSSRSSGLPSSSADMSLPVAPPFPTPNASPLSGKDLLARVEIENELRYTDLQSFVCTEHMSRFKAHYDGQNPRPIDNVKAQVAFENGVETYSGIEQNNRLRNSLSELPGAWSEGEFGTLLRQTRTLLTTQPLTSQMVTDADGDEAVEYTLSVPGEESPWNLSVGRHTFRVPFVTDVLVSRTTGRILRIKRTSSALPEGFGISQIQWSVNLKPVELDEKQWLLPTTGEYSVLYAKTNKREYNLITFADYHRYTASSVMHF